MRTALIGVVLIIAAAVLALFFYASGAPGPPAEKPPGTAEAARISVRTEPLETVRSDRDRLEVVGTTAPDRRVPLSFRVSGRVHTAAVETGNEVKKGDVLAALDKRDFRIALREAEALVATARAGVEVAEQSGVTVASRELARTETLRQAGGATEAILDRARAQDKAARAQLLGAEAELERALALRDRARAAMTDTVLRAPFNAVVIQRLVEPGQMIGPTAVAFVLEDVDRMRILASVPAADLSRIDTGQPVAVRVDEAAGFEAAGEIRALGWTGDPDTGTFPVEVVVQNPDHRLRSGMTAALRIAVSAAQTSAHVYAVPLTAVVSRGQGKSVFVVEGKGTGARAKKVPVRLVGFDRERAMVTGDFGGSSSLITSGQHDLRDGKPVEIRNAATGSQGN